MDLNPLRESVEKVFTTDSLYQMTRICRAMGKKSDNPVPFFVMQKTFVGIVDYWDEVPGAERAAGKVHSALVGPLKDLIDAIDNNASIEQTNSLANKVVMAYYAAIPY